jgi:hypothetical protein
MLLSFSCGWFGESQGCISVLTSFCNCLTMVRKARTNATRTSRDKRQAKREKHWKETAEDDERRCEWECILRMQFLICGLHDAVSNIWFSLLSSRISYFMCVLYQVPLQDESRMSLYNTPCSTEVRSRYFDDITASQQGSEQVGLSFCHQNHTTCNLRQIDSQGRPVI